MDIIVCVKHVPETAEADIKIDSGGKKIEKGGLVFDVNEWDDYALEEAVLLKEKLGGTVSAITVGPEDADSTLRKCLARGADKAIRLTDPKLEGSDGYVIAKILHRIIKDLPFDLIMTGALAGDDGYTVVDPEAKHINCAIAWKDLSAFEDLLVQRLTRKQVHGLS